MLRRLTRVLFGWPASRQSDLGGSGKTTMRTKLENRREWRVTCMRCGNRLSSYRSWFARCGFCATIRYREGA